jgi:nitrogen fixation/metabolism regulation signal transduction histidine kinase
MTPDRDAPASPEPQDPPGPAPGRVEIALALEDLGCAIAHKLKNPLAGMMLAAMRLKKRLEELPGEEKASRIAGQLGTAIERLSGEVDALVRQLAALPMECSPADVDAVLDSVPPLRRCGAGAGEPTVRRTRAPAPAPVIADAALLRRAFSCLLAHALDAAGAGGTLRIETALSGKGSVAVQIEMPAGTPAFPPEPAGESLLSLLNAGAPGLRVAVARRIFEMHGARLVLREAEGRRFAVVTFPRADPVDPPPEPPRPEGRDR